MSADKETIAKIVAQKLGLSKAPLITEITQGQSHHCFSVIAGNQRYFVKVFSERNALLSGHRFLEQQAKIAKVTGRSGLSPKLISVDSEHRLLINEYVAGQSPELTPADNEADTKQNTQTIKIVAECAYRTHQLVFPVGAIDLRQVIMQLLVTVNFSDQQKAEILAQVDTILDKITIDKNKLVCCHGDINFANILLTDHTNCRDGNSLIQLLDWEYACLAEREYEIAMSAEINQLSRSQISQLIHYYQQLSQVNGVVTVNIDTSKVTRYFIIASIINRLWRIGHGLENGESFLMNINPDAYKSIISALNLD